MLAVADETLSVVPIGPKEWAQVEAWMRARGEELAPRRFFPPVGYVVGGCVAGFLFQTDCATAYVGSIVADPASSKVRRKRALAGLLEALKGAAKRAGYEALASSPSVDSLRDRFLEAGFVAVRPCTFVVGGLSPCR